MTFRTHENTEWVRETWQKPLDAEQINRMLHDEHRRPVPRNSIEQLQKVECTQ